MSYEFSDAEAPTLPKLPVVRAAPNEAGVPPKWPYEPSVVPVNSRGEPRRFGRNVLLVGVLASFLLGSCVALNLRVGKDNSRQAANVPGLAYTPLATKTPAAPTATIPAPTVTPQPTATPTEVPTSTVAPPQPPPVPPAPHYYTETQEFGAHEWANYHNASGEGAYIAVGQKVLAVCIIYDPNTAVPSTGGLWYRLTDGMYAPSNTFVNNPDGSSNDLGYRYDPTVPVCGDSPSQSLPPVHA